MQLRAFIAATQPPLLAALDLTLFINGLPIATFELKSVTKQTVEDAVELFKQFSDSPEFKRWLTDTVFAATYDRSKGPTSPA